MHTGARCLEKKRQVILPADYMPHGGADACFIYAWALGAGLLPRPTSDRMPGRAADAAAIRGNGDTRVANEPHHLMPRRKNSASDQQPWDCLRCQSGGGQRADAKCPMATGGGRHLIRRQISQSADQPDEDTFISCYALAFQSTVLSLAPKYPSDIVLRTAVNYKDYPLGRVTCALAAAVARTSRHRPDFPRLGLCSGWQFLLELLL